MLGLLDLLSTLICLRWWVSTEELGAATLAAALFPILDRLGGSGLVAAVVREPDDAATGDSLFWLGVAAAGATCVALNAARPLVAPLLPDPIVASLLCAYGGKLVVQTLSIVPEGRMKRAMRYRELSLVRMWAMGIGTAVKLGLAALGAHGLADLRIWCFALGPIATTVATTIGVQLREPWRPRRRFDRAVAARAARFTAALSGGELLYFWYTSADYLVVGAVFGKAAVGAYRLAYELVLDVVRLISLVTAEVAFPAFVRAGASAAIDVVAARGALLVRFTRQNLVPLAAFLAYAAIEADDLLGLLYPPLPPAATTAARILCVVGALRALGFVLPPLLAASGRASRVLAYEAVAAVLLPAGFLAAALVARDHGFVVVAWGWAAGDPIAFAVLLAMTLPTAGIRLAAYARAISGITACALVAAAAATAVRLLLSSPLPRVFAVAATLVAVYLALLAWIERITPRQVWTSFRR